MTLLFPKDFSPFFFNWRVIDLQCCVSFCHTRIGINFYISLYNQSLYINLFIIYVLSFWSLPLPSCPTLLGSHTAPPWLPVFYSSFPLPICCTGDSVHMSMVLSQFFLPSPSPVVSTSLFCSLCIHFFLANRFISTIFLDSIYMH